jgi:glycosyltransferase involved in cell wall biosynthesis
MDRPIPVLHVQNKCSDGSIARIVERIIAHSPKGKFEWHVCSVNGQDGFEKEFEKINAKVIDFSKRSGESRNPWQKINQYIIENNIHIVHSHTPRTILEVWKALSFGDQLAKKKVIHLATKHSLTTPKDRKWGLAISLFDHLALYMPDHLVAVSCAMANKILAHPGLNSTKVTVIQNAIPANEYYQPDEREECRRELGLTEQMFAIGFTGRIEKVKNLDLLINAFKTVFLQYPNSRLVIIGNGEMQTSLQNQAKRLGIAEAVLWPGFCSNIPRMLSAIDMFVQTSVNEGLPLSLLEAMAAKKPIIATRVGGTVEVIQDGQTGILVDPGSEKEIAIAILNLIGNTELLDNLAAQGRQFVFSNYDIQRMVNGYCDLYQKLDKPG